MASHKPKPTFQFLAENQVAVAETLVVACADPRSDPSYVLGLNFGGACLLSSHQSSTVLLPQQLTINRSRNSP
jgi:carbonic anhydrase